MVHFANDMLLIMHRYSLLQGSLMTCLTTLMTLTVKSMLCFSDIINDINDIEVALT